MNIARHLKERAAIGLAEQSAYRFLVYSGVGVTKVSDGVTGRVRYTHAEASTAIQWALDHLTPERQHKEKVVVMGDYTLAERLLIPSYTIVETQGSITGTASASGIFENAASATDIELIGGYLDPDNTSTPWNKMGVKLVGCSNFVITRMTVVDAGTHGISLSGCENGRVYNNTLLNCGDDGVSLLYSKYVQVFGNRVIGGANNGNGGGSAGIEIEDGSHDVTVYGNTITGITDSIASAIHCITDPAGSAGVYNISIFGNTIYGNAGRGIGVINNKTADNISAISATGDGTVEITSAGHGLTDDSTWKVIISGVTDSGLTAINGEQIATYIDADTFSIPVTATGTYTSGGTISYDHTGISIASNVVDDVDLAGIQLKAARHISVANNVLNRCGQSSTGYNGIGVGSGVKHCQVIGNTVANSGSDNILVTSGADQILVSGNTVRNAGQTTANKYNILINAATNVTVSGNQCIDDQDTKTAYGIRSLNGGPNRIFGNEVASCKTNGGLRILSNGTGDLVFDNIGHKTRKSGSTGAIASGATVAHGLASTPTNVTVTPKDTGVTDFYVTADATNLTITYSGGGTHDFWWQAAVQEE